MTKKWVIVISIFAILVVGCVIEYRYVNSSFDTMAGNIEILRETLTDNKENIDIAEIEEYLNFLHEDFHEKEKVLKALIWHTGLKDVEIGISRIMTYCKNNDYVEAMAEANALFDYCSHYSQDFQLLIENIF